jgi:hypothetical protein
MINHGDDVAQCLSILGYEVKDFDKDGIEIYFTISDSKKKHRHTTKLVDEVKKQFTPKSRRPTGVVTNINHRLGNLLEIYQRQIQSSRRRHVKPKIIFILTDAIWRDECDRDLRSSIANLVSTLDQYRAGTYQVGIQFIQFGNDAGATQRLQWLDSGLGLTR